MRDGLAACVALVVALGGALYFMSSSQAFATMPLALEANLVGAGVALVAIGRAWWRLKDRRFAHLVVAGLVGLGLVGLWRWAGEAVFPWSYVTVLQEGRSLGNLQALYGHGAHAWPSFHAVALAFSGGDSLLLGVVRGNVAMAIVATGLFATVARQLAGSWLVAAPLTAVFALNPCTFHAALSETAAPLIWLYLLVGAIGWWLSLHKDLGFDRVLGLAVIAIATALFAGTRPEGSIVGFAAIGSRALDGFAGSRLRSVATTWTSGLKRRDRRAILATLAIVAALAFITVFMMGLQLEGQQYTRWGVWGIAPFNPAALDLPPLLLAVVSPIAVALFVIGWARALATPLITGCIALTVVMWFRIYESAGHRCLYEMLRYMTYITPIALLLAAHGVPVIVDRIRTDSARRMLAATLGAGLLLAPPIPGAHDFYKPGKEVARIYPKLGDAGAWQTGPIWTAHRRILRTNQQLEVRFLLAYQRLYDDCILLARVASQRHHLGFAGDDLALMVDGVMADRVPAHGVKVADVITYLARRGTCVRYYKTLDCNFVPGDRCADDMKDLTEIAAPGFASVPYSDIDESGRHTAQIRLGIYGTLQSPHFQDPRRVRADDDPPPLNDAMAAIGLSLSHDLRERLAAVVRVAIE